VEGPLAALEMLFEPISLMLLCGGTAFGIILGALPGLSATMGLALAMPFTYYLSVEKAMPLLLGLILGPMAEPQFRRSMVLFQGDWTQFFSRPISLALFTLTAAALLSPALRRKGR